MTSSIEPHYKANCMPVGPDQRPPDSPLIVEPAVQLAVPHETGMHQPDGAGCALQTVLVVRDVHHFHYVSIADGAAALTAEGGGHGHRI